MSRIAYIASSGGLLGIYPFLLVLVLVLLGILHTNQGQTVHESEVIDRGDRLMTSRKTHTLTEERLKMSDTSSSYD